MTRAVAKAHANLALVKYWGKRNESLILPMNGSISMTLQELSVVTRVEFHPTLTEDQLVINGTRAKMPDIIRMTDFLDIVRLMGGINWRAQVVSNGNVPLASGLSSSSSAYAALALASTQALGLYLSGRELSLLARRGSGSATRSIYGGLVEWMKGEREDGKDSYALPLSSAKSWDLAMVVAIAGNSPKRVSSREGMKRAVMTSVFYRSWLDTVTSDLNAARKAIFRRDFTTLGCITEASSYKMHGTTMGSHPAFTYWQAPTVEVIHQVESLRDKGIECYASIDAGAHVGVLCQSGDANEIYHALSGVGGITQVLIAHPGPGTELVDSL